MNQNNVITISMPWESNLSVNGRYTHGGRPRLRPEVQAWQEELAWQIKSSIAHLNIDLGPQVVVDIQMYFPQDGRTHDADNYLKSILDGVEWGTGIDDSNFIPFIRDVKSVPSEGDTGFLIAIYSASFAGHGLRGRIETHENGVTMIVLNRSLPAWSGTEVTLNLGVIRHVDPE